jgi:hypothetical protein
LDNYFSQEVIENAIKFTSSTGRFAAEIESVISIASDDCSSRARIAICLVQDKKLQR